GVHSWVPVLTGRGVANAEVCGVLTADSDVGGIVLVGTGGGDLQAGLSAGATNQPQHLVEAAERFARPVDADRTEEAMLDWIPFRGAGGIVGDREGQPLGVGPVLQRPLPQARAAA